VFVKPLKKDTAAGVRARRDSLVARFYNDKGAMIRTLTAAKIDTGLNYINWMLDERGVRSPTSAGGHAEYVQEKKKGSG
jgi:hypothetical protein